MVTFALVLLVFGNLKSLLPANPWPAEALQSALALTAVPALLVWARNKWGLSREELGLRTHRAGIEAVLGLAVGALMALPSLVFLRFPPALESPIVYDPVRITDAAGLLQRVLLWMPLDTILLEEVAFRGILLAALLRRCPPALAVLASAVLFSAWHVTINYQTVALTNLRETPLLPILGLIGAHVAVFGAGLVLAIVRIKAQTLAPCLTAHWAVNTAILFGLFLSNR